MSILAGKDSKIGTKICQLSPTNGYYICTRQQKIKTSKRKAFADDKFIMARMIKFVSEKVKKKCWKRIKMLVTRNTFKSLL